MGDEFLNLGGVRLNKADVKNYREVTVKNDYGRSEKRFIVIFNNGTQVAFRGGQGGRGSISSTVGRSEIASTDVYGVMGLEIRGSQKYRDEINVAGGSIIGIDVTDGGGYDEVNVQAAERQGISEFGVEGKPALDSGKGSLPPNFGQIRGDSADAIRIDQYSKRGGIYKTDK